MSFLRLTFVYLISGAVPVGLAQDYTSPRGPLSEINSIQQLIQLVDDNRDLTTLEKVLHALPVPLRSSPVFIYRSESLQSASPEFPRVLLSDPSGNLVLAFNGESKQTGFDKLEALEFDEKKNRFNFYEMKFSSAGKLEVSKPNPSECLSCHRFSDPRPNWESYDQWPGVYGSNDDRLRSEEVEPFKNFLNLFELNPRYSALRIEPLKQVLGYSSHYGRLPNEPNISFTHRLSRNNFKRLARLIMESPDYEKFKYMIGGFLSSGEGERFSDIGYLPEKISGLTDYYSKENIREVEAIAISYANSVSNPATLTFRSLFESRGIDTSDWFMNFKGALTNSFVNGTPWEDQLLEALLEKDSELRSFLYEGSNTQLQEAKLKEVSHDKLVRSSFDLHLRKFDSDPEVPQRIWRDACRQCHERGAARGVPQFDFNSAMNKPKLKELIESGAMPMNQRLTPSQKKRFVLSLSKVKD